MSISYVGAASAASSSVTLPTHQTRDLIFLFVYRDNNANTPAIVAGWTLLFSGGANTNFLACYARYASSSSMTSGTWTNTTHIATSIYRSSNMLLLGAAATTGASSAASGVTYSTLAGNTLSALYVGCAGIRVNDTDIQVAPTGMTNRTSVAGGSTGELALHDTNGTQDGWSGSYTLTSGTTTAAYRSGVIQIIDSGVALPSGGNSLSKLRKLEMVA